MLTFTGFAASVGLPEAAAVPPFPINDPTNGTFGASDTYWQSSATSSVANTYTKDGWLRLTDSSTGQATNILNNTAFPSSLGFRVSFDYRQAGGIRFPAGTGLTGDGIAMYLVTGTSTISQGAAGAALGYGSAGPKTMDATNQMCTTPGVSGGYLGLGLDVYGNYASPNFGNGGGPGSRSGIGLRGSGDGCNPTIWAQRYPWVNGSNTMDLSTGASGSGDPAGVDNSKYRRVSITVVPSGSNVTVTVAMSELAVKTAPAGAMTQVFTGNLSGVTGQRGLPSTLKLGFSASTGSASDYHDIRNILVQAITDTSITKALDSSTPGHTGYPAGTFLPGDPISFTMTATNNGPSEIGYAPDGVARVFDDMRDLPITDVSWTCTASADATCANGDSGTGPIVSQDWTGKKGASVTVKVTGTVVAKAGSYTNTAILPTDFTNNVINPDDPLAQADGGAIDLDTNNNKATANFKVLAPNFTQVKTADLASYTVGQPITYTVVVTNSGTAPGTADLSDLVPSSVRVTDASCDGSAGVTCSAAASGGTVTGSIDAPIGGVATFTITGEVVSGPDVTNTATINPTTPTCDLGDCGGGDATTPDLPVLAPHLTLTKTATVNDNPITNLVANQTVTYKYAVTNDGQTPVSNFGITETNFTGSGTISAPSCPVTALAVGESTTCTATYTVTQADVDARTVTNTATAHGTAPGINTPTDSDPSSATLRTHLNPVLTLAKTATVAGAPVDMLMAGQKIDYSFVVTNMGNVTMSGIRIGEDSFTGNDPLGPVTCPTDSLAPGESEECTTTYTVTQSDVDQGSLANSAYAYGTAPGVTTETRSNKDTAMLPLDQAPAISVTKEGSLAAGITTPQVGDLVNFVISVANNGNVSLRNIDLTDGLSGVTIVGYQWPATVGILAPGATLTVDATYAVTQDDIDSGSITNRADVTADDPDGGQVDANDTVVVNLPHTAKLDLEKTGAVEPGAHQAGQTVTYTFKATNNGNVTLTDVTINDPLLGSSSISYSWPGTPGTLAPGQSVTGTASYVLKQSDMNAGQVYNEATVTGTPPSGPAVTGDDSTTVLLTGSPSVSMVKTGVLDDTGGSVGDAGDLVDYEFDITNTGNVTLTDVTVIDLMPNLSNVTYVWPHTDGEPDGTLAPGETATGTATYQLTQADVDAGGVTNAATVKGNPPNGPAVTDDETFVLRVTPEPSIGVVKHGELTDNTVAPKAGSTVDYTISITNNGNVTLTGVTAEDILLGAATINYTWPGTPGTLAPGEEATAEATYALTQGEIDAGVVENLVTVSGTPPTGPAVTGEDTNRLSLTSAPSISLIKTGSVTTDPVHAGDNVRFEFEATNDGNVTLSDVSVADNLPGVSAISYTWPDSAQPGVVGPGQSVTGVATYAATQADIDAGHVHNDATVTATPPSTPANPNPPAVTGSNDTDVFIPFAGALTMHKIASDANGDPVTQLVLGETVYYSFVVENTGNATVSGIGIDDSDFTGTGTMSSIDCPSGALAPGDSVTCTATYVVTQADVDAGKLTNTATAGGTRPGSDQRVDSPPDTVLVPSELLPALTVTKTDDLFGFGVPVMAGDRIGYTITAKNSGNVSLTGVTVTDALLGGDVTSSCNWPGTAGALVPGEKATCSGSYTLTQADIDAGTVTNTATGTGVDPEGTRVSDTGEVTTDLTATPGYGPGLGVVKTADRSGLSDPAQVGDPIVYTIKATNTGNLTLTGVVVRDDLLGGDITSSCTWPATAGKLLPGQAATCTVTYLVTQADIDAGGVTNTATAQGVPPSTPANPNPDPTPGDDTITTDLTPAAGLTVTKTDDLSGFGVPVMAGDRIGYTITAKNTGNVTLTGVTVTDALLGGDITASCNWTGTAGALVPGEKATCPVSYPLTQADIDAGTVTNTATGTGVDPEGTRVSDTGEVTTDLTATPGYGPGLGVVKTADRSGLSDPAQVGDPIVYTIKATNTGNLTLTGVVVRDDLLGGDITSSCTWPATAGKLLPGQSAVCTVTYLVTQADIDAGGVTNTATAQGIPPSTPSDPNPDPTPGDDTITTDLGSAAGLTVTKTDDVSGFGVPVMAGDRIGYTITAKNSGNVTLTGVTVTDALLGGDITASCNWPGTAGALVPGEKATCPVSYPLTQADIDAGTVTNTATGTGVDPEGTRVSDTGEVTTDLTATPGYGPGLGVVKTADRSGLSDPAQVGDQIVYTIKATNTGNLTLTGVTVRDNLLGGDITSSCTWPATVGKLLPGQSAVCTVTYLVTQADIDAGGVTNTATAQGIPPSTPSDPNPDPTPGDDTITTDLPPAPGLAVHKSASDINDNPITRLVVGSTIYYHFVVENTGNVTLNNIAIDDTDFTGTGTLSAVFCPADTLAGGRSMTCSATYVVTQADVDAGVLSNTATASGNPPRTDDPPVDSPPDTVVVTSDSQPGLTVAKTADRSGLSDPAQVGDPIVYTITATNTGDVTLTGVTVSDALLGGDITSSCDWPGAVGKLAPEQAATCTVTYLITQADVDAGGVTNTATAQGVPPSTPSDPNPDPTPGDDTITTDLTPAAGLTVTKTDDVSGFGVPVMAGDRIGYTITAKNSGNVTLTGVTVTDALLGGDVTSSCNWPGTAGALVPGEKATCSGSYPLTQADIDAGTVTNTATGVGFDPDGTRVSDDGQVTTDLTVTPGYGPGMGVVKTADTSGLSDPVQVGDRIVYTITATNTGNLTLTGVTVTDNLLGGDITSSCDWPATAGTLLPGQAATCTLTYLVAQTDVDAGGVTNTATATGIPPSTPANPDPDPTPGDDTITTDLGSAPGLTVTKTDDVSGFGVPVMAGDRIGYTITAKNSGNVSLTGVTVTDALLGGDVTSSCNWPGTAGALVPGEKATCSGSYTLTQADIDAGTVSNTATGVGYDPDGTRVSDDGRVITDLTATPGYGPGLGVVKTADKSGLSDPAQVGDPIVYTITATNTGNLTLTGVTVRDNLLGGDITSSCTWPVTAGTLLPGQSAVCTVTYLITQADIDAGGVTNTATATGLPPSTPGNPDPDPTPGDDTITTDLPSAASISLTKTGSVTTDPVHAGDTVRFQFRATNDGNVTLTGVTVTDHLAGVSSVSYTWPDAAKPGVLEPGETATGVATYTVRQADIDAGRVHNTATVTGTPPSGPDVSGNGDTDVTVTSAGALTVHKSASDVNGHPITVLVVGNTVYYHFVVTNTGNVTLNGISIDETDFTGTGTMSSVTCTADTLAPGDSTTCDATYVITQADVDAGTVTNTATAGGTPPDATDPPVDSPPDTVTVPSDLLPSLSLHKTGALAAGATGMAGDVVEYTFTVTNTGNITVRNISISDQMAGLSNVTYNWPGADGMLTPGQQMTATATYTLTQSDVDAGGVHNAAVVTDTPGSCTAPATCDGDSTDVLVTSQPSLDLIKTATFNGGPAVDMHAGDVVDYKIKVTNSGNVTLSGVNIIEQQFTGSGQLSAITCPANALVPGGFMYCTAKYTVAQDDVDVEEVSSTSVAQGTPPAVQTDPATGNLVLGDCPTCIMTAQPPVTSNPGTATATMDASPALSLLTTANVSTFTAGTVVTYSFNVTNTGGETISNEEVLEDAFTGTGHLSGVHCPPGSLAPGQVVVCTATYTATPADVAAGTLSIMATAFGDPPSHGGITPSKTHSTPSGVTIRAAIVVVQTGGTPVASAGAALPLGLATAGLLILGARLLLALRTKQSRRQMPRQ